MRGDLGIRVSAYRGRQGVAFEHLSPMTATAWISMSEPGTTRFVIVI
jgi:hypothetical protein